MYCMLVCVVSRLHKDFWTGESDPCSVLIGGGWIWKGIWVVWNSGEVLPDRIKWIMGLLLSRWGWGMEGLFGLLLGGEGPSFKAEREELYWPFLLNAMRLKWREHVHTSSKVTSLYHNDQASEQDHRFTPSVLTFKQRFQDQKLHMICFVFWINIYFQPRNTGSPDLALYIILGSTTLRPLLIQRRINKGRHVKHQHRKLSPSLSEMTGYEVLNMLW